MLEEIIGKILSILGSGLIAGDLEKIAAIAKMPWPTPTNVRALQELHGLVQYLANFVPSLSTITRSH